MGFNSFETLKLIPYEEKYRNAIANYDLPKEQAIYTSYPIEALEQIECEQELPVLILLENDVIGFFILDGRTKGNLYTNNKNAIVFKSFSIDQRFQGRKLGEQSINILSSFTKKMMANKNEIILTVHHTNIPAIHLYRKCGFIDKGIRYSGEHGDELVFHYEI
ncbi:GNAT family N-acetyltransferase [Bacillus sp. OAE603]|uniref:GNAT family N-acetyltransferase n=1 Tax=Gottfriedia sp. OAE603 TaxID=2663872 RepID=UPI00178B498D